MAHFESRNEVTGRKGIVIEVINNFIENLKKNNVATIRQGRSGEEKENKSAKGKTTFDIEFNLIEQESVKSAFLKGSDLNKLNNFEG